MRALQLRIHELHAEMERLGMAKVCVVGLAWSFVGPRVTKGGTRQGNSGLLGGPGSIMPGGPRDGPALLGCS